MQYLLAGMVCGLVAVCIADAVWAQEGGVAMAEAFLFITGFTAVSAIYEIAKTAKSSKSENVRRAAEQVSKKKF